MILQAQKTIKNLMFVECIKFSVIFFSVFFIRHHYKFVEMHSMRDTKAMAPNVCEDLIFNFLIKQLIENGLKRGVFLFEIFGDWILPWPFSIFFLSKRFEIIKMVTLNFFYEQVKEKRQPKTVAQKKNLERKRTNTKRRRMKTVFLNKEEAFDIFLAVVLSREVVVVPVLCYFLYNFWKYQKLEFIYRRRPLLTIVLGICTIIEIGSYFRCIFFCPKKKKKRLVLKCPNKNKKLLQSTLYNWLALLILVHETLLIPRFWFLYYDWKLGKDMSRREWKQHLYLNRLTLHADPSQGTPQIGTPVSMSHTHSSSISRSNPKTDPRSNSNSSLNPNPNPNPSPNQNSNNPSQNQDVNNGFSLGSELDILEKRVPLPIDVKITAATAVATTNAGDNNDNNSDNNNVNNNGNNNNNNDNNNNNN
ncbi:hypothetical protein RFI_06511, partial [Reticulomyxa filosa]